ncbi:MAG TPA: hypothetical protein PLJ34_01610 [Hyphomicrobiales bacterium]|nr:hypothetical protein [Hyphomicrobiales bacterium]
MSAQQLLDDILASHGGRERWQSVTAIDASLSSGGFAFTSHCQPTALRNLTIHLAPHERRVVFGNFGGPGGSGHFAPDRVAIHDADGRLVAERHDPRRSFARPIKNIAWDRLDILYFAGYAIWNYLWFPGLLDEPDVTVSLPKAGDAGSGLRLAAEFAPSAPTHSARQLYHFDDQLLLTRHDYTADVIGGWATAANCVLASEIVSGLRFYTRRKVFPRMGPRQTVLPLPLLVWIEIDDLAVTFAAGG